MVKAQPVIAGLIARWVVAFAASRGMQLSTDELIALFAALEVVINGIVWKMVTPNAKVAAKVEEAITKRVSIAPGALVLLALLPALSTAPLL